MVLSIGKTYSERKMTSLCRNRKDSGKCIFVSHYQFVLHGTQYEAVFIVHCKALDGYVIEIRVC